MHGKLKVETSKNESFFSVSAIKLKANLTVIYLK